MDKKEKKSKVSQFNSNAKGDEDLEKNIIEYKLKIENEYIEKCEEINANIEEEKAKIIKRFEEQKAQLIKNSEMCNTK